LNINFPFATGLPSGTAIVCFINFMEKVKTMSATDTEGSMELLEVLSKEEGGNPGDHLDYAADVCGSAATAASIEVNAASVVGGLTRQIPLEGKGIRWAPILVTYMGSTSDFDTEMLPEGSVHLSESSFEMTSSETGGGGGVMEDFNSGMREMSTR
jgi:hypothetical protein